MSRLLAVTILALLVPCIASAEGPSSTVEAQVTTIRSALREGDVDGAVALAEKAAKEDPKSSMIQLWLGRAYGQKARKASVFTQLSWAKKCKTAFERSVSLDPESLDARTDLLAYHVNAPGIAGGDKEEARRQAEEIRKRDPVRGHLAWGSVHEGAKDFPKAEAEYRSVGTAVDAEASLRARAFWRLGLVLEKQGRTEDAKIALREALKADASFERARRDLERLEKG